MCARSTRAFNLVYTLISQPFRKLVKVVFSGSGVAVRYVKQKVIISGDRVEVWQYENPIRADLIDRADGMPEPLVDQPDGGKSYSNLRRSRSSIRQLVWCNLTPYTKFITLTYKEIVLDINIVNKDMQNFFRKLKRKLGIQPAYIWVPEPQRNRGLIEGNSGCLHIHIVLFNCDKIPLDILNSCWPHGRTDIRILNGLRLSDNEKIECAAAYLSKYISKDNIIAFGAHSFRASLNLKRPIQTGCFCFKIVKQNGIEIFQADDRSFDISSFQPEFKKSYLLQYEIDGEPV